MSLREWLFAKPEPPKPSPVYEPDSVYESERPTGGGDIPPPVSPFVSPSGIPGPSVGPSASVFNPRVPEMSEDHAYKVALIGLEWIAVDRAPTDAEIARGYKFIENLCEVFPNQWQAFYTAMNRKWGPWLQASPSPSMSSSPSLSPSPSASPSPEPEIEEEQE